MADQIQMRKLADKIRQLVTSRIDKGLRENPGMVTITDVRVTGDLHHAQIFFTVYGADEQREKSLEILQRAAGYFRRELAAQLKVRFTPTLEFILDALPDNARVLEELFDKARRQDEEVAKLAATKDYVSGPNPYREPADRTDDGSEVPELPGGGFAEDPADETP